MTVTTVTTEKKMIRWSAEEYNQLARQLLFKFPQRRYDLTIDTTFHLTLHELEAAMRKVLPPKRHRKIQKLWLNKQKLLLAFDVVTNARFDDITQNKLQEAPILSKIKLDPIFWDENEWKSFASILHNTYPAFDYSQSKNLDRLLLTQINKVSQMMPPGRQRSFVALGTIRTKLLEIYGNAPIRVIAPNKNEKNEAIIWTSSEWQLITVELIRRHPHYLNDPFLLKLTTKDVFPSQTVLPLARQRQKLNWVAIDKIRPHIVTALAAIMNAEKVVSPLPQQMAFDNKEKIHDDMPLALHRIKWTGDEWLGIATELHRAFPRSNFLNNDRMVGLDSADVAFAQRVLPEDRRRPQVRIVSFKFLRPKLLIAFDRLKNQLATLSLAPELAPVPVTLPVTPFVTPPVTPPVVEPINEWEAAFKPACDFLFKRFGAQLGPMIAQMMQMAATPQPIPPLPARVVTEKIVIAPALAPVLAAIRAAIPAVHIVMPTPTPDVATQKTPRPHVGVLGNRSDFVNELNRSFPHIEFIGIESIKKIDSVRNCQKVMVLTKFISHSNDRAVKTAVGERYVPVNGSVSECKRIVTGWMSDGILPCLSKAMPV